MYDAKWESCCDNCFVFECLNCSLWLALTTNHIPHSSKDTFVKLWDLDTQHCFHTIVGHRSEVRVRRGGVGVF